MRSGDLEPYLVLETCGALCVISISWFMLKAQMWIRVRGLHALPAFTKGWSNLCLSLPWLRSPLCKGEVILLLVTESTFKSLNKNVVLLLLLNEITLKLIAFTSAVDLSQSITRMQARASRMKVLYF